MILSMYAHTHTHTQVKALAPQVAHASKIVLENPDSEVREHVTRVLTE